jgi:carbon storage regulator
MLVLTRKVQESVVLTIGDVVGKVTVLSSRGDKIRLGFEFPHDVVIHREEVQGKVDRDEEGLDRYDR